MRDTLAVQPTVADECGEQPSTGLIELTLTRWLCSVFMRILCLMPAITLHLTQPQWSQSLEVDENVWLPITGWSCGH